MAFPKWMWQPTTQWLHNDRLLISYIMETTKDASLGIEAVCCTTLACHLDICGLPYVSVRSHKSTHHTLAYRGQMNCAAFGHPNNITEVALKISNFGGKSGHLKTQCAILFNRNGLIFLVTAQPIFNSVQNSDRPWTNFTCLNVAFSENLLDFSFFASTTPLDLQQIV